MGTFKTIHVRKFQNERYFPAGTWRKYNVASTSMQRHELYRYVFLMSLYENHNTATDSVIRMAA